ncbi:MAG: SAM-dependent chlorinase/fluorinase [bacterium]|nr:SAM-dependent chlorinase/fluorinase [bacterium]
MHRTIINDCRDANAVGRQMTRVASLLGGSVSFVGVTRDIEAAGNLIDVLDAFEEDDGVVLVNVAPRSGPTKRWENGTPFGYFWYKQVLVLASIGGLTLSLVKKLGLVSAVSVLDVPQALDELIAVGAVPHERKDAITRTQFRSYDFLPRVAAFLASGNALHAGRLAITEIPAAPAAVWCVDNFGNCKTTLLAGEVAGKAHLATRFGELPYFSRLKDVPDHTAAIVTGSSGLGRQRFVEIVLQGGSAAAQLSISVGDDVL